MITLKLNRAISSGSVPPVFFSAAEKELKGTFECPCGCGTGVVLRKPTGKQKNTMSKCFEHVVDPDKLPEDSGCVVLARALAPKTSAWVPDPW